MVVDTEVAAAIDDSVPSRCAAFLRAPRVRAGIIEVTPGSSVYGPRGIARRGLGWRDLAGDGRYVFPLRRNTLAEGVDSTRLAAAIETEVAGVIQMIKDEREPL